MLLLQMLRQMRQSMTDETSEEKGLSADTMLDMVDTEFARQLSQQGGFGLADVMKQAIRRQIELSHSPESATANVASGWESTGVSTSESAYYAVLPTPGTFPALADHTGIPDVKVTSNYGWRADPFTGAAKYHQGVDLKAAYGQSVPAAADGTIVEAEEHGAYGLTVLIEHGDGVRTRYAHLASADVAAGDRVLQGQEIGRVGQSGRATGPHLHFEVIRNGQRVDPATVVSLQGAGLGGLKLASAAADFPVGGRVNTPAIGVDDED